MHFGKQSPSEDAYKKIAADPLMMINKRPLDETVMMEPSRKVAKTAAVTPALGASKPVTPPVY